VIEVKTYQPKDIVPRDEIIAWKERIRKLEPKFECPDEVKSFVNALSEKLGDFGQRRKYHTRIPGKELLLCNMKELNGQQINKWDLYDLPVPHMIAVDNYSTMMRIFRRKGKQGLIDYCKAKVEGTELESLLTILNVNVFHIESPEFTATLARINASKKLEIEFEQ